MVGFDVTPRFHPTCGAWGSTPSMTELDIPLLARCLVIKQDERMAVWYGLDLSGDHVHGTDATRTEIATALGLEFDQIIWSTSQTHSSGAMPGSPMTGSCICDLTTQDAEFMESERKRFMNACIDAAKEAISKLQPATVWTGRGYCDSISFNRRFPMPNGGVKFSRDHAEGLQSGKPFDTTIGLVRFDDAQGNPVGSIFNFGAHPATMILDKMISPDWVGTARQHIEAAMDGAPAMYCQGFCGNVNCYYIFGSPAQAKLNGSRLGKAAVDALPSLMPVRSVPFDFRFKTIEIPCQPMPTKEQFEAQMRGRQAFVDELQDYPRACWFCGVNIPEWLTVEQKTAFVEVQMKYLREGLRMLDAGEPARTSLKIALGALRIGDMAAVFSPGENFSETGMLIRNRSPFAHTLICGDTNGLFGYLATDKEIERGGYEADSFWKMLYFDGFRLPPAKGTTGRIVDCCLELLQELRKKS